MIWVYRGLVAAMALLFGLMGMGYYLDPVSAAGDIGLEAMSPTGMSALHGDMGGLFMGCVVLLVLGLIQPRAGWLLSVAVIMATIAFGRVLGFLLSDSVSDQATIALGAEIVFVVILLMANRFFRRHSAQP